MEPLTAPEAPQMNPDVIKSLGQKLSSDFVMYERDRRMAEIRWVQNLRQYIGKYDDTTEKAIPQNRSRAYPKLTRVKCVSMVARLMNLLFPTSDKNWGITASPVPNLSEKDLQSVLDSLQQESEVQITDEIITDAVREFAQKRARNLEIEIEDQLTELGGTRSVNYVTLCKKVLVSGVLYGMGVLKGPMARTRMQRRWRLDDTGTKVEPVNEPILVPQYEFVPLWDYYPDMSAKYTHQMDGQFQRMVMSRQQFRKLADNSEFMRDVILKYLTDHQTGNYKMKQFETEIKSLGVDNNRSEQDQRKYEVILWDGMLSGHYLKGCGVAIPDNKLSEMVHAVVWIIDREVIRANLNPWVIAGEDEPISNYHHFIFEEDETMLTGNGLPHIMRDSQLAVAAATRMMLDNAGVVCGPNLEVNQALLIPGQDVTDIYAYKSWLRDDESPATVNVPAVRSLSFDSHIDELMKIAELFRGLADTETFISPMTGGDMQKGPSEPFRTAAGASMIQGQAALPFKDVVRNFDQFTESVIGALVTFNKHFSQKESIKGDFQVVARGSTSLIAKEVRGMGLDDTINSLQPEERPHFNWRKLVEERVAVRDLDPSLILDEAEVKRREDAAAEQREKEAEQREELMRAEVRKTLAEAVKNLTQADKNTAAADTTVYNGILAGLEKGVAPDDVVEARMGGGVPEGVIAMKEMDKPPKPDKGGNDDD